MLQEQYTEDEYKKARDLDGAVIQVRVVNNGNLHLQGYGNVTVNRDYGFATQMKAPTFLMNTLTTVKPKYMSFASVEKVYERSVTVTRFDDGYTLWLGTQTWEFTADNPFADNGGISLWFDANMNTQPLIDFCEQNDLLDVLEGNRPALTLDMQLEGVE
mgnify:FL=1|tara:strand:- start:2440 stop:2916 length:477 start_codon:yes stop_codon:yes gene_type:complete